MTSLDFLRSVEVFKGLNDSQLAGIRDHCREMEFRQNEKLFSEGDDASCLWIVNEGRVDLRFDLPDRSTSTKNTISSISEFKTFGWSSLVENAQYTATAIANTDIQTLKIDTRKMNRVFNANSLFGLKVYQRLSAVFNKRLASIYGRFLSV